MWDLLFENKLDNIIPEDRIFRDEPMYKHTTFRIGGPVGRFVSVTGYEELRDVISLCKEYDVQYYIIGNGSNLLVSDKGYDGVIIEIGSHMRECFLEDGIVGSPVKTPWIKEGEIVGSSAGVLLSSLANFALKNSLSGLEFAAGIPGSVGGAMVMNAGAYGGEMKDVVSNVTIFDSNSGEIRKLSVDEMEFSYRHSIVKEKGYVVLAAEFKLQKGDMADIKATMDELAAKRREKQPLEYPSAGSTFKRPEGYFAGKLIQDSGLKGYTVGGAQVSDKHSGFVINRDNARAEEVYRLICDVREKVYADSGVMLEPEVIMLGEF
ncbi:MAG: UDP-N-acetylmuramate dehydrogenase [Lachnospiraceae bacterium]|nr:UDP-N-acetylmuramate dehydrogenase [Candidatus Colinaster scatohippi]